MKMASRAITSALPTTLPRPRRIRAGSNFLAYHDALTGLPNRMLANDRLEQAMAHAYRSKTRVAVMFLDLDDFKTINDTLGHSTGDRMLTAVADRLRHAVRATDTVSRQAGMNSW